MDCRPGGSLAAVELWRPILSQAASDSEPLHRLIYFSRSAQSIVKDMPGTVRDILRVAILRNREADVSGALLACDSWFVQALEGSRQKVGEIYSMIANDRRHQALQVISAGPVETRNFAAWSMCGETLSPVDDAIVRTLEAKAAFDPSSLTGPSALKLLGVVGRLQAGPKPVHYL